MKTTGSRQGTVANSVPDNLTLAAYLLTVSVISLCHRAGRSLAGETVNSAFLMSGALVLVGVWVGTFSRVSIRRKA